MNLVKGQSFYCRQQSKKQYPYLTENIKTEILIIGGGVTGALALYQFLKKGFSCVLVDESRFGMCSTSITTALLQYELEDNFEDLMKKMSVSDVENAYTLGSMGLKEVEQILNDIGNDCDFEINDTLLLSNKTRDIKALQTEFEYRHAMGYPVKFYDEMNNPTPFLLKAGVFTEKGGARLNPYKFTIQLLESADGRARLFENTKINSLTCRKDKVLAKAQHGGCIIADKVILATGYDTILGTKRRFCKKQITYNIEAAPTEDMKDLKILARDNMKNYHYFRQIPGGNIIFGGSDTKLSMRGIQKKVSGRKYYELLDYLNNSFLEADENFTLKKAVSGVFGVTPDNLGVAGFDKEQPNIIYCLGYGANGILFAAMGAKMLADECRGESQELLKLLDPFRSALSGL